MRGRALAGLAVLLVATSLHAAETLKVDRAHSNVGFEIRHLMSTVTGSFKQFDGTLQFDRTDPTKSSVEFVIDTASIDTGAEGRDKHLRSADFFDAESNPKMTFKSKGIAKKGTDTYDVTGDFTMHGVTKEITIPVRFLGMAKGGRGNEIAGFKSNFTLNRKDYGVVWNRALDAGGALLGDDVDVRVNLQMGTPPPPKPAEPPPPPAPPAPEKKE
jgi:polyisoprenoid-binding protein YceI